jgi:hypothetical protein
MTLATITHAISSKNFASSPIAVSSIIWTVWYLLHF